MRIEITQSYERLKEISPQLQELAHEVVEPNPFFEPWLILPALKAFGDQNQRFVLIWSGEELQGFFPFEVVNTHRRLPLLCWQLWKHRYCFACTPLLRLGREDECLAVLFQFIRTEGDISLFFQHLPDDGPKGGRESLASRIANLAPSHGRQVISRQVFSRSALVPPAEPEKYLREVLGGRTLKDYRRKLRKLNEIGPVSLESVSKHQELDEWIEAFLRLEGSGWKKQEGTALISNSKDAQFFREIIGRAFEQGALIFDRLMAGERLAAMRCGFQAGDQACWFKTAYDESLSQSSPGALLEFEGIMRGGPYVRVEAEFRQELPLDQVVLIDACADPKSRIFNELFSTQRHIRDIAVSGVGIRSRLGFWLLRTIDWVRS